MRTISLLRSLSEAANPRSEKALKTLLSRRGIKMDRTYKYWDLGDFTDAYEFDVEHLGMVLSETWLVVNRSNGEAGLVFPGGFTPVIPKGMEVRPFKDDKVVVIVGNLGDPTSLASNIVRVLVPYLKEVRKFYQVFEEIKPRIESIGKGKPVLDTKVFMVGELVIHVDVDWSERLYSLINEFKSPGKVVTTPEGLVSAEWKAGVVEVFRNIERLVPGIKRADLPGLKRANKVLSLKGTIEWKSLEDFAKGIAKLVKLTIEGY